MNASLKFQLERVMARQRRQALWLKLAGGWALATSAGLFWLMLQRHLGWNSWLALPAVAGLGVIAAITVAARHGRQEPDWEALARELERRYPDLDGRLVTAVQQQPRMDQGLNYLQERVVWEALCHSHRHDWVESRPRSHLLLAQLAHWTALVCFLGTLTALRAPKGAGLFARLQTESPVTVTPGDTSLERGSSLVVLTRFTGALPSRVELVVGRRPDETRTPLVRSLADAIFGGSVAEVTSNLVYHVAYDGRRSRDFAVKVFEYPRLERADLQVTFPQYTGLPPERREYTRRLSAVEGSHVDLSLRLNKRVAKAWLAPKTKESAPVPLSLSSNQPTAELSQFLLQSSQVYELRLVDTDGRSNKVAAQFVFEVLSNRVPELHLASPRGDLRLSPLEEIHFEGTVWDDFGVRAYGLGYAAAGREMQILELGKTVPAKEKRAFKHVLRLEDLRLQPDQLVSWFVWAEDVDPSGQIRRTTGDLFFGEIRPFDEVFREGQPMAGGEAANSPSGEAAQGSAAARLTELQKQIILATWRLQQAPAVSNRPAFKPSGQTAYPIREPSETIYVRNALATIGRPQVGRFTRFMGQLTPSEEPGSSKTVRSRLASVATNTPATAKAFSYEDDIRVLQTAEQQALEQLRETQNDLEDPRAAVLVSSAVKALEKATDLLKEATVSRARLAEALAAEQAAYQALLKLQEHEYQVVRSRNRRQQGAGGQNQQMQRQLEELEMTQTENRYETQRQAQAPSATPRGEQLQAMNRLQELARRQQDLNERLKELQSALQAARTEQERAEIQRRLKRLEEEEQQMLADVDELRQRMDRPENQSTMAEERRQLEQARDEVQRAAEAAGKGATSQALASGTRAQRQLQQVREQLRRENSSQFAEDLRQMRSQARELSRQQDEIARQAEAEARAERKSLSDSPEHQALVEQLNRQREQVTNLVARATQLSEQAEPAEPILSRQLYDTVRKFSQDSAKEVKDLRDQLLNRGLMTRNLYDRLNDASQPEGAKLQDITSEMVRLGFPSPASQAAQRARPGVDNLRRGVEHAAESVLGDDAEALRLAQQELDLLTDQLRREMAQAEAAGAGTNASSVTNGPALPLSQANEEPGTNRLQAGAAPGGNALAPLPRPSPGRGQNQPGQPQTPNRRAAPGSVTVGGGEAGDVSGSLRRSLDQFFDDNQARQAGPVTGDDFVSWSDRLREVEEMLEPADLRNEVAGARERARTLRQQYKTERKKPDWAVVRLQVVAPLVEVRERIAEELAQRASKEAVTPIDRDPVPNRFSELVRRYYEDLGKEK